MKRNMVLCAAMIGAVLAGCGETDFSGGVSAPIGNPDTNVNVSTGDVNVDQNQTNEQNQTTNVSVIQDTRIGDNISINNARTLTVDEYEEAILEEEPVPADEVVEEVEECIPVADVTEDQLVEICVTLAAEFSVEQLETMYFSFEGLEGVLEVGVEELVTADGEVCFTVEFLEDLGIDPFEALGGLEEVGEALLCEYQFVTEFGVTPVFETVIIEPGVDCDEAVAEPVEQTLEEPLPTSLEEAASQVEEELEQSL